MAESAYVKLAERLDMNIRGVPKKDGEFSPAFMEYLKIIFTSEEAEVASFLSVEPNLRSPEEVAELSGRPLEEVEKILSGLHEKGLILGLPGYYMLPPAPPLLNVVQIFGADEDNIKKEADLYQEFFIEEGFYKYYTSSAAGTPMRRAVPVEQSISDGQQVLSYEDIDTFLDQANMEAYAFMPCPCRSRTEKMGIRECKDQHPVFSCVLLGMFAVEVSQRGGAKRVTREEVKKYLEEGRDAGLVIMVDNAKEMADGVICLCCECCCSTSRGLTRWNNPDAAFGSSDFVARVSDECITCGECVDRCMFKAIIVEDSDDKAQVDEEKCMGCGVCTVTCPAEAIKLERFEREPIYETPQELFEKVAAENEAAGQRRPVD
jgi:Pyruvate/2-oxoacid:ferredoxin oxidoreductase delta subunit